MTVVVTGASGLVGPAAVAAFASGFPHVRAYVRRKEAAEPLRALGAKVAVGDIDDVETLRLVMRGAHTVCHLAGGLNFPDKAAYEAANLGSVRTALEVAHEAGVKRFLLLSYPGASPDATNPFLRYKGMAEHEVAISGLEHAIVRSTHVYGVGGDWFASVVDGTMKEPALVIGSGSQVLAPVFVDDVAAVLAAADHRGEALWGTWALEGPERVTADEFADLLAEERREKRHLPPERAADLSRLLGRPISAVALEVISGDSVADAPDAAAEFGVKLTPLRDGLDRTMERALDAASGKIAGSKEVGPRG